MRKRMKPRRAPSSPSVPAEVEEDLPAAEKAIFDMVYFFASWISRTLLWAYDMGEGAYAELTGRKPGWKCTVCSALIFVVGVNSLLPRGSSSEPASSPNQPKVTMPAANTAPALFE